MRKNVKFATNFVKGTIRGYEGAPLPVDKLAEFVLASTEHPIKEVSVTYGDDLVCTYQIEEVERG